MIEYMAILHCEQEECLNGDRGPIAAIEKMKESARNRGWIIDSIQCRCARHLIGKEKPETEHRVYNRRIHHRREVTYGLKEASVGRRDCHGKQGRRKDD